MNKEDLDKAFNGQLIVTRAKDNWNTKEIEAREKTGKKYEHLFSNCKNLLFPWANDFDSLSVKQRRLLIKGELIRTYDSIPNILKTKLKEKLSLSTFSSKWYKLPSEDKTKLLKYII